MTGFRIALTVAALITGIGGMVEDSWTIAAAMFLVLLTTWWPVWRQRHSRPNARDTATSQAEPPAA